MAKSRKPAARDQGVFGILRQFSWASLAAILAAAFLLTLLYRQVAVGNVVSVGEHANLTLARAALLVVKPRLLAYLEAAQGEGVAPGSLPAELDEAFAAIMRSTAVVRIKVYGRDGTVLFSTRYGQIGQRRLDNPAVVSALGGEVASKLLYQERLNPFDRETGEDKLIQSYLPVRAGPTAPVLGVFEIYTDVNPMVRQIEEAELLLLGGSLAVMLLLYAALLAIVRRAGRVIEQQQATIRERSLTLELLSSQLISAEENKKRQVAQELHEGIAQTLAAVKLQLESACSAADRSCRGSVPLQAMVPVIQDAIQELRAIAIDLRPPSLDELGALAALNGYCRELGAVYPQLRLEQDLDLDEADIPPPLKVVLFRVAQQHLQDLARHARASRAHLGLDCVDGSIVLTVKSDAPAPAVGGDDTPMRLATLGERVKLAGGSLEAAPNDWGGTTVIMSWPR